MTEKQNQLVVADPKQLNQFIESRRDSYAALLPRAAGITPERFAALAVKCIASDTTGKLAQCTKTSILLALLHSAELGLQPGGPRAKAYMIPYWNKDAPGGPAYEAQFQVGVWGLKELAFRSGKVASLWGDVIYSEDRCHVRSGSEGLTIDHEPRWDLPDNKRGEFLGSYSICKLTNGEQLTALVRADDVYRAKAQNRGKSPAWETWFDQMAIKVAHKRNSKSWPESDFDALTQAVALDDNPATTTIEVASEMRRALPEEAPKSLDRLLESRTRTPEVQATPKPEPESEPAPEPVPKPEPAPEPEPKPEPKPWTPARLHAALADWDTGWMPAAQRAVIKSWDAATREGVIAWLDRGKTEPVPMCLVTGGAS